jgi:hypothetical protein
LKSRFVCFGIAAMTAAFAAAQTQRLPDAGENHWAYLAVKDLANKGLVKGHKDGKFLDGQEMTKYEFAALVGRVLETVDGLASDAHTKGAKKLEFGSDTLNEIEALTVKFQDQLTAMQADVKKSQEDIDSLRADVDDAKDFANKARQAADASYGSGSGRKFSISGYIQTRFDSVSSRDATRFPNGSPASTSGYNGNYQQGGAPESFVLRRSRLKVQGQVTPNTKYTMQLDAGGLTSGTNQAVTVREGNIAYTPGDGSSMNPTMTVGLFANPFGYILPQSSNAIIPVERPLAFNENSEGIWANQDYDRGVQFSYGPMQTKYTLAFVNGSGRTSNDTDRTIDTIARIAYQAKDKTLGAGISFYNGHISYAGSPAPARKKQLLGLDAQYNTKQGAFLNAEYVAGKFEQTTYFDEPTLKLTTANAPGNKISGYYAMVGNNFGMKTLHPWSLAFSYDVLRRSSSGTADSGSSWDDVNFGGGVTYNLDSATRFKLWYISPSRVAHPSANPAPHKTSLLTTEIQVKF